MNVSKYIEEFKKQVNIDEGIAHGGEIPKYPLLVMYLGDDAAQTAHETISSQLFEMWPPYEKDLEFLKIDTENDDVKYSRINGDELVDGDLIKNVIMPLHSLGGHFASLDYMRLYFIMKTEEYRSVEDYIADTDRINHVMDILEHQGINCNALAFMLLDEIGNFDVAAAIRNYLIDNKPRKHRLCIVNNRLQNSIVCNDWTLGCQAIASVIAVSDSTNSQAGSFFSYPIATFGFYREEKPVDSIAQITVDRVLSRIDGILRNNRYVGIPGVSGRRLDVLDEYVDSRMSGILSRDTISCLPVSSMEEIAATDNYDTVNDLTMGVLDYLLSAQRDEFIDMIKNEIRLMGDDSDKQAEITRNMVTKIKDAMNFHDAAVSLTNETAVNSALISEPYKQTGSKGFAEEFSERLKHLLSSDPVVHSYFKILVGMVAQKAMKVNKEWIALLNSMGLYHGVADIALRTYYTVLCESKMDDYDMEAMFGRVFEQDVLEEGIRSILVRLINENPIYRYDLIREKNARIEENDGGQHDNLIRTILNKDMYRFFSNHGTMLNSPVTRVILLNNDINNMNALRETADTIAPYYTGSKNFIDLLDWYEVNSTQLIIGDRG